MKKRRIAGICVLLLALGLGLLLLLLKGWTTVQEGSEHYLAGHGEFDAAAAELMPRIEELPQNTGISVIYRREYHLIERGEYLFLWLELSPQQFADYMDRLEENREAEEVDAGTGNRFYMLPTEESGETEPFCVGEYRFDPQDVSEIDRGGSDRYARLIGTNETESRIVYVFLRDDRGAHTEIDGLLILNDFVAYAAAN